MEEERKRKHRKRKRSPLPLILLLLLAVGIAGVITALSADHSLELELLGDRQITLEYGEVFQEPGVITLYDGEEVQAGITVDQPAFTRPGLYEIRYTAAYGDRTAEAKRIVLVVDTTPPEITLKHLPGYIPELGSDYEEEGYTAADNCDGDLTDRVVRTVNGNTVTYTVTDDAGNSTTVTRDLTFTDTTPPVITLLSVEGYHPEAGSEYIEEGYSAADNTDGDLTDRVIRTVSGNTVTYTVTDSYGNTATVTREIIFQDTVPPVLTLKGDATVTINAGGSFTDPGAAATDAGDGDLTAAIKVTGGYDRYLPGTYTLTYSVTDSCGNTSTAQRKVIVTGLTQPDPAEPGDKVIYLTFDDGPGKYTPALLEILEKYNVKATFFVVGSGKLEYLKDIAAGGHSIGIHSNTHVYSDIYASEDAFFKDFNAIYDKIFQYTGIRTKLCRFPGGSSNTVSKKYCDGIMTKLTQAVVAQGFQYFDWNVDSNDAGDATTSEAVFQNVIAGVKGKSVSVVLQHDIKDYSIEAVEKIIQWGLANGYTFLPLEYTSPAAHHSINN